MHARNGGSAPGAASPGDAHEQESRVPVGSPKASPSTAGPPNAGPPATGPRQAGPQKAAPRSAAGPGRAGQAVRADQDRAGQNSPGQKRVLEPDEIRRALTRIAHEILERTNGAGDILLLGIPTRGVPLAQRLAERAGEFEGRAIPWGSLDVTMYRDDLRLRPARALGRTELPPAGIDGKTVVLVDDVLYSGRTVRAALDALTDLGRPKVVQLAVLVDRGHRELPIRADYVGKNLPTSQREQVRVLLAEIDGEDAVLLGDRKPDPDPHSNNSKNRSEADNSKKPPAPPPQAPPPQAPPPQAPPSPPPPAHSAASGQPGQSAGPGPKGARA
jgi:pyrimidine operon attenuation protein/uracil phosphoribosyltransferase